MARSKRQQKTKDAAGLAARTVGEQAWRLHGLRFSAARCAELAIEAGRHAAAIAAAAPRLDFNDEPARFTALLRSAPDGTRR